MAALQQPQLQLQLRALSGRFASSRSSSTISSGGSGSSVSAQGRGAPSLLLPCRRPPSVARASYGSYGSNGNNGNGNGNGSSGSSSAHHLLNHHQQQQLRRRRQLAPPPEGAFDLVLSSGFLAFALHTGFLKAVEEAGVPVAGIMGTSAGALAGSLYAAGYSAERVARELSAVPPIQLLRPCWEPWRGGVLSMDAVLERLRDLLPPTFEDLERDFAVGVVDARGNHVLIDEGPLPEAVVASAAIPFVFAAVDVPQARGAASGAAAISSVDAAEQAVAAAEKAEQRQEDVAAARAFKDGGVVDRIGVKAWRERRRRMHAALHGTGPASSRAPLPPCLVHVIERSSPFSGEDDAAATGEAALHVVRSPKSGVSFFDLGAFGEQFSGARGRALPVVQRAYAAERRRAAAAMGPSVTAAAPMMPSAAAAASSSSSSSSSSSAGGGAGSGGVVLPMSAAATAAMAVSPGGKRGSGGGTRGTTQPQPQRAAPPTVRPR